MRVNGVVADVEPEPLGDELTADASLGATTLTVDDAVDFDETGGTLAINGQVIAYTSVDDDTGVITLAEGLDAAAVIGDRVDLWDPVQGGVFAEWIAYVEPAGNLDNDDVIEATITSALIPQLPEGIREPGQGESVVLELQGYEWIVTNILSRTPVLSGEFIDPDSFPEPPSDGLPPASSPTPTALGMLRLVMLRWPAAANADAVTYDVYGSTTSGFTKDATTLLLSTAATAAAIDKLTDGTPLAYDTTYWFAIVARDVDGAATPGDEVAGALDPAGTPDLAVGAIVAAHLEAILVLASQIKTAESGRRMELSNAGLYGFESDESALLSIPTDGSASIINMDIIAKSLLALNGITMRGTSTLTKGSAIEMESATKASLAPPTVVTTWPSVTLAADAFPTAKRGLYWNSADSTWFFCVAIDEDTTVTQVDTAGATVAAWPLTTNFAAFNAQGGITKIGSTWYVLGINTDTGNWHVSRHDASFNVLGSWQYTHEANGGRPAIGNDGTNILIARVEAGGGQNLHIRAYNPTTGAAVSDFESAGSFGSVDVQSVATGSFDLGTTRYVVAISTGSGGGSGPSSVKVLNTTTGAGVPNEEWLAAHYAPLAGLAWNGTQWWSLSASSATKQLSRYTDNKWTTEDSKWWVGYTYRDGDATGGTHETPLSPKQSFTMLKRARLAVTTAAVPDSGGSDDPDRIRVWIGRLNGSSAPANSAMWLNASPAAGVAMADIDAAVFSGTALTAKDADFPLSTPSELRTVDGIPLIRANGLPRLRLLKSTVTTAHSSPTSIGWDSASADTDDMWDSGDPSVFQVPWDGQYLVTVQAVWPVNGTGYRWLWVEGSSTGGASWFTLDGLQDSDANTSNVAPGVNRISLITDLSAANLYRVRRQQTSGGGALNLDSARLGWVFMGPS